MRHSANLKARLEGLDRGPRCPRTLHPPRSGEVGRCLTCRTEVMASLAMPEKNKVYPSPTQPVSFCPPNTNGATRYFFSIDYKLK